MSDQKLIIWLYQFIDKVRVIWLYNKCFLVKIVIDNMKDIKHTQCSKI